MASEDSGQAHPTANNIHEGESSLPDVAFLGMCQRARHFPQTNSFDLLGVSPSILSCIFPLPLIGAMFATAIYDPFHVLPGLIEVRSPDGTLCFSVKFEVERLTQVQPPEYFLGWQLMMLRISDTNLVVQHPGIYRVFLKREQQHDVALGYLEFVQVTVPPLTEDRIAALRSNPSGRKTIRLTTGCGDCGSEISVYTSLDRIKSVEEGGGLWYEDVPDSFRCACGKYVIDLRSYRETLLSKIILNRSYGH